MLYQIRERKRIPEASLFIPYAERVFLKPVYKYFPRRGFRWGLPAFAYITSKASQIGRGGGRTAEKSKT